MADYKKTEVHRDNITKRSEKFWNLVASKYDKSMKHLEPLYLKIISNIRQYLNKSDTVMDYGCGTGAISIEIANQVKRVHAIDISNKMLDIAKRKADEQGIDNVEFIQSTIFDERFKKESFDLILAIGLLHLLKENKRSIERVTELLKPGGLFISSTPCMAERTDFLTKLRFYPVFLLTKLRLIPGFMNRLKIVDLTEIVSNQNIQIIEREEIFHTLTACYIVAEKHSVCERTTRGHNS